MGRNKGRKPAHDQLDGQDAIRGVRENLAIHKAIWKDVDDWRRWETRVKIRESRAEDANPDR